MNLHPTHQPRHRRQRRNLRRGSAAVLLSTALVGAALAVLPSGAAGASDLEQIGGPVYSGRAYSIGISDTKVAGIVVPDGASPDTGYVSTDQSSSVSKPCTNVPAGLVTATATCVNVSTNAEHRAASATTSVATAHVGVPGLPVLDATAINATSVSNCFGSFGSTTIAYLKVGSKVLISAPTEIAPNTTLNVGVLKIVLNEQQWTPQGLLVNAIHVKADVLGVAKTSVVVSSAQSRVSNCSVDGPGVIVLD